VLNQVISVVLFFVFGFETAPRFSWLSRKRGVVSPESVCVTNTDGRAIRRREQGRKKERKEEKREEKKRKENQSGLFAVLFFGKIEVEHLECKKLLVKCNFSFKIESVKLRIFTNLIVDEIEVSDPSNIP
jgi:hypothetical protein